MLYLCRVRLVECVIEELLKKYDLYHSSIICGGNVKFNINYLPGEKIYVSLVFSYDEKEDKYSCDIDNNGDFKNIFLPKIVERFLSKNVKVSVRKIMGKSDQGTLIIQRNDLKDYLIIRNCKKDIMDFIELLQKCFNYMSNNKNDSMIIFNEEYRDYDDYMKYNILFDFAMYKNNYYNGKSEIDNDDLLTLNIARLAYSYEDDDVWDKIIDDYKNNNNVAKICYSFKECKFDKESIYTKALSFAEFEKNNDTLIHSNEVAISEALEAVKNNISYFDNNFLDYWKEKQLEYNKATDEEKEAISIDFINSADANRAKNNKVDIISKLIKIKEEKEVKIVNDTQDVEIIDEDQEIFKMLSEDEIKKDAEFEAKRLFKLEQENRKLQRDAEEYAKEILKHEKEYREIKKSADDQAKKILELIEENEKLKKMAEENALYLLQREKLEDEIEKRKHDDNTPVKSQDIDKINNLLHAISEVKNLDFAVKHPVIMQELSTLEEKTITYLTTHKNIVIDEDIIVPIEKEEMLETKPVIELLSMVRNAYTSSFDFEKDGRHTLINFNPVDSDTYRVSLVSIKGDDEDLLMDVFFEDYQLTDNVLKELCDIYKENSVIVASKIDNIPPDKADYLVIDNLNNAIRFMDCNRALIDKVKKYL